MTTPSYNDCVLILTHDNRAIEARYIREIKGVVFLAQLPFFHTPVPPRSIPQEQIMNMFVVCRLGLMTTEADYHGAMLAMKIE